MNDIYLTDKEMKNALANYIEKYDDAQEWVAGRDPVPVSGKFVGTRELRYLLEAVFEMWWTDGKWCAKFEKGLSEYLGAGFSSMTNSGSSANLLAIAAAKEYFGWPDGSRVLTLAAGFPTTINPIIQNGLKPVFLDIEMSTYLPRMDSLVEAALSRPVAIFMAHTLGNPLPILDLMSFLDTNDVVLIEDNCDALGSTFKGQKTGTFGVMATQSFYPAHHITTGEGGAVVLKDRNLTLKRIVDSYRDWGRECWCPTGQDNTCGKRYEHDFPMLPKGFDHKYVYSRIGYNLKSTDLQAAIGVAQLEQLEWFTALRAENFDRLMGHMLDLGMEEYFYLPSATNGSAPSWFGFPLTVKNGMDFTREEIVSFLNSKKIATRNLFAGNILRHPAYTGIAHEVFETLLGTNKAMHETFWIGCWPGITDKMIDYVAEMFKEFFSLEKTHYR